MRRTKTHLGIVMLAGLLAIGVLTPTAGRGQTAEPLQQVEKRLAEKRAAAEAHRKQMETIKDPEQLSMEMRRHFQMTEDTLGLLLERRKLLEAQAPMSSTPSGQASGMQGGGMQGGMMQKEMGGMQGGGMQGGMMQHGMGMMQKEMGGMQGGGTQGSMQGGGMQGGMQGGGMAGGGMSGHQAPGAPGGATTPGSDMEQMMKRLAEHSAYMETLKDQATLAQEMLRHQKMLDQMLQLMQE